MAIEALPEVNHPAPRGGILEELHADRNPEFDRLRKLRKRAKIEQSVVSTIAEFIESLRAKAAAAGQKFQESASLEDFKNWTLAQSQVEMAHATWQDYSNMASVFGHRCFKTEDARAALEKALQKAVEILSARLTSLEDDQRRSFEENGLEAPTSESHPAIMALKAHVSKMNDGISTLSGELTGDWIAQAFSKYGALLPLTTA